MGADLSAACVALKCTHYDIPIDQLSSGTQQQKVTELSFSLFYV